MAIERVNNFFNGGEIMLCNTFFLKGVKVLFILFWGIVLFVPSSLACTACLADLDTNGTVDGSDLAMFSSAYGSSGCLGNIYVDAATGEDIPGNGCVPEAPYKSISYAVARASACSATTIYIAPGTYVETLVIKKDHLTLRNKDDNSRAVVIDGSGSDVITIEGARGTVLSGMTIQNGKTGIFATQNAFVSLDNIGVQNMTEHGISYTLNASGFISGCSVQNAARKGFFIFSGSFVYFLGPISAVSNGEQGICVITSAGAMFYDADITVASNGWDGLWVGWNSNILSQKSTLQSQTNGRRGIGINSNSSLRLLDSDEFLADNNTTGGVILEQSSTLQIQDSASLHADNNADMGILVLSGSILENYGKLYSQGNVGIGIDVWASSGLVMNSTAGKLIIRDTVAGSRYAGFGLVVYNSSSCSINRGTFVSENNASKGISIGRNSQAGFFPTINDGTATIQNNAGGGIVIEESSSAHLNYTQIIDNTNMGILLIQNSNLRSAAGLSVQRNTTYGIHADDGSSADLTGPIVQTNTTRDIKLEFESRLTLRGAGIIGTTDYEDAGLVRNR